MAFAARTGERGVMIANLSLPAPVAGASLEALCLMRSKPQPLVRERHTRSAGPFALRACGLRVFGSALPYAKHYSSFGARTGARTAKLRAHGPRAKRMLLHWREAFREWTPSGKAKAISLARPPEGPSPMAEPMDRSRSACKPFRSARPVRAPKAEHWQSSRQSASKDAQATGQG